MSPFFNAVEHHREKSTSRPTSSSSHKIKKHPSPVPSLPTEDHVPSLVPMELPTTLSTGHVNSQTADLTCPSLPLNMCMDALAINDLPGRLDKPKIVAVDHGAGGNSDHTAHEEIVPPGNPADPDAKLDEELDQFYNHYKSQIGGTDLTDSTDSFDLDDRVHPATWQFLSSLPCRVITPEEKGECGICDQELTVGENILILPCEAMHAFHRSCLGLALSENQSCPTCAESFHSLAAAFGHGEKERMMFVLRPS